jgi:hypothetical protein
MNFLFGIYRHGDPIRVAGFFFSQRQTEGRMTLTLALLGFLVLTALLVKRTSTGCGRQNGHVDNQQHRGLTAR